jgi:hypothetical protein
MIGDVVGSRSARSQEGMFVTLQEAHGWLNERVETVEPVDLTVGDEFQGIYPHVRSALRAAVLLRLYLRGSYDSRFGIGWGEVTTVTPEKAPMAQSGAGWWRAREAIEEVAALARRRGWPRSLRTRVRGLDPSLEAAVNAFLLCQDHLIDRMDSKDAQIALALFEGRQQAEVASRLQISQSSVSRRQAENGPASVYRAQSQLELLLP